MKAASFFSGIGGIDLGIEKAGIEVVFQCEILKFGQQILRKHWREGDPPPKSPSTSECGCSWTGKSCPDKIHPPQIHMTHEVLWIEELKGV